MASFLNPLSVNGYGYIDEISRRLDGLHVKIHVLGISDDNELEEVFFDCRVQETMLINFLLKIEPLLHTEALVRVEFKAKYLGFAANFMDQSNPVNIVTMKAVLVAIESCIADDVNLWLCSNRADVSVDRVLSVIL